VLLQNAILSVAESFICKLVVVTTIVANMLYSVIKWNFGNFMVTLLITDL
jgi:hypothetical protein